MNRDRRVLLGTAAAVIAVLMLYVVRPLLISRYETIVYGTQVEQSEKDETESDKKVTVYVPEGNDSSTTALTFRNQKLLNEHYEKHGKDMGFDSAKEYEKAAAAVPVNPDALHKTEAEDGDDVYYLKATNEFVIVSTDGYIRTYFKPDSGIKYFNKQ